MSDTNIGPGQQPETFGNQTPPANNASYDAPEASSNPYGQQAAYGQQPGYDAQQGYDPLPAYGQQPGYVSQPSYGQPPYAPPAPMQQGFQQPAYGQGPYAQAWVPPVRSDYASWGKRVAAGLIDSAPAIVGELIFFVGYVMLTTSLVNQGTLGTDTPNLTAGAGPMVVGTVVMLAALGWQIYNRWITAGKTGQSLGKRVLKIRLISEETGGPVGGANAFLRDLVHILDGFAYVGYLWPLWDEKRQTFSDKIMKTVVIDAAPVQMGPG